MSNRGPFPLARVHRRALPLAALALALSACGGDSGARAAGDSALAHDLALANVVASQPELNDAPVGESPEPEAVAERPPAPVVAPRPATPAPRPRPAPRRDTPVPTPTPRAPEPVERESPAPAPAPAPAAAGFAAGTRFALTTHDRVCTVSGRPGDKITATLRDAVHGSGGAVIPAGATLVLEVASVEPGEPPESGRITFRVRSLDVNETAHQARGSGTVQGDLQRAQVPRVNASDRRKVITGAVAGAILGRVLGGDTRGAVIGAAAGGAAGAVKARSDQSFEGCLPAGSPVPIVLDEALTLTA